MHPSNCVVITCNDHVKRKKKHSHGSLGNVGVIWFFWASSACDWCGATMQSWMQAKLYTDLLEFEHKLDKILETKTSKVKLCNTLLWFASWSNDNLCLPTKLQDYKLLLLLWSGKWLLNKQNHMDMVFGLNIIQ